MKHNRFTSVDHDQIGALFFGLERGHSGHVIDNTLANIESPSTSHWKLVRNYARRADRGMHHAIREAGIL